MKNKTQKTIDYLEELTKFIHGWTAPDELEFLYRTASLVKKHGVIVEIGSWQGRSTVCLAKGAEKGNCAKVYAIDPFTGSNENQIPGVKIWTLDDFKNNLKKIGVENMVTTLAVTSEIAAKNWNTPIDFLFIDGAHEYDAVEKDFLLFSQHVVNGGIIAFHDTTPNLRAIFRGAPLFGLPGPRKVVVERLFNSKEFKNIGLFGSIIYATKCEHNSLVNRFQNKLCQMQMNTIYFIYSLYCQLKKIPKPIKYILKPLKPFQR